MASGISAPAHHGLRKFPVLLTASIGCAMMVLDSNVVGVILPTIGRDLGARFADIQWVVSTYFLAFASLLMPAGAIADRFGRRRIFLVGIIAFAATSLVCGLAPSARYLYLARAFQGAAAAFLLAPALAIIGHAFHGAAERNRAWGIWGGILGLAMVVSPILGGLIVHALGWRFGFHLNVPICLLLWAAAFIFVRESRDRDARRLDPVGIGLFAAFMFGLTWGFIQGQAQGWASSSAIAGFTAGGLSLAAFIAAERAHRRPMLDLALFADPRFIGGIWAMFAYAVCAQVLTSLLPLFLQNGLGYAALHTGFAMLPFTLAMLIFPHIGRILGRRMASESVLALGLAIVATGNAIAGWGAWISTPPVAMLGMFVIGSGGGLLNGETQKAIMSVVPPERAGMSSGVSATARFAGILLGFALLSGVLATMTRNGLTPAECATAMEACRHLHAFADAVVAGDPAHMLAGLSGSDLGLAVERARTAYSRGFAFAFFTAALIAVISAAAIRRLMRARALFSRAAEAGARR